MKLSEKIQAIVDSNYTSYKIEKESGISTESFGRYRSGQRDIKRMTLETAEKLEIFYEQYLSDDN
jgi:hypothetical protein|nr:MAG TPA: Putative antitoxin of bacterial toxin-antitoxin system, YdaS/YdaT [Caudoviricetes sp.]